MSRVLQELAALVALVKTWRQAGDCVVLTNGAFDLFHVGPLRSLEGARALGDRLVVAVNDDASVTRQKGPGRPFMPAADRAEIVAGLRCVDAAFIFGDPTVTGLLGALRPDIHAKGIDYTEETVPEREAGVDVQIVGDAKAHSTTDIARAVGRWFTRPL